MGNELEINVEPEVVSKPPKTWPRRCKTCSEVFQTEHLGRKFCDDCRAPKRTVTRAQKPLAEMTEDERRSYQRESTRRSRRKAAGLSTASDAPTQEAFWAEMRALLEPETLAAYQAHQEAALDQMHWMEHGQIDPAGVDDLLDFIHENPPPRLGYFHTDVSIPPNWSDTPYWQDSELTKRLTDEGLATERWVKYGYLSSIPDWRVIEFLTRRAGWTWRQATDLLGIFVDESTNVTSYNKFRVVTPPEKPLPAKWQSPVKEHHPLMSYEGMIETLKTKFKPLDVIQAEQQAADKQKRLDDAVKGGFVITTPPRE